MRLLLGFAVMLGACAAPPVPAAPVLGPPGTVSVRLTERLGWPYRLDHSVLAVDGQIVSASVPVAALAGAHTIMFRASLSMPCSTFSKERMEIQVRSGRTFALGVDPAAVDIVLLARGDATTGPGERVRVQWRLRGAKLEARMTAPPPPECMVLDEVRRAECIVEHGVNRARIDRDIVDLTCKYDKLQRIRAFIPRAEAGDVAARAAIRLLALEAEQCVGDDLYWTGEADVVVTDRCGPELEDPKP